MRATDDVIPWHVRRRLPYRPSGPASGAVGRMTKIGPLPRPSDGVPYRRISSRTARPRRGSRSSRGSAMPANVAPPIVTSRSGSARRLRAHALSGAPAATRIVPSGSATNPTVASRDSPDRRPRVRSRANLSSVARSASRAGERSVPRVRPWPAGPRVGASSPRAVSGLAARTCPRSRRTARRPSRPAACRGSSPRRGRPSTAGPPRRDSPTRR